MLRESSVALYPLSRLRERVRVRARWFASRSSERSRLPSPRPLPQAGEGKATLQRRDQTIARTRDVFTSVAPSIRRAKS